MTDDADSSARPEHVAAYFALLESASLLQHAVNQQLRADGDLSYIQFQLLARLSETTDGLTMTDLADGVVYSRSGLTHQAGLLETAGLITRRPSRDDERATVVSLTDAGRDRLAQVLPGHIEVARQMLVEPLNADQLRHLGESLTLVRDHMRAQPPRSAAPRRARRDTG